MRISEHSRKPLKTADSANHGSHLDRLSTHQNRPLRALAESSSIAAARKADVGDRTLRQCLREDGSGSDGRTREFGELGVAKCRELHTSVLIPHQPPPAPPLLDRRTADPWC